MKKNKDVSKLTYESDGKMGKKKGKKEEMNASANFFNTTPSSE
nr:hypothetical protein [Neobacillus sp. Marseille-Q6967]